MAEGYCVKCKAKKQIASAFRFCWVGRKQKEFRTESTGKRCRNSKTSPAFAYDMG